MCCVYVGASARACAALHWVPARARESTGLAHTLCAWPRRSPQRRHAHSSPTSRARHRSQGHAPSTVPPLSTEVRAVDASSRGVPASAADPASAASVGVAAEKKTSQGEGSRRPAEKKKSPGPPSSSLPPNSDNSIDQNKTRTNDPLGPSGIDQNKRAKEPLAPSAG